MLKKMTQAFSLKSTEVPMRARTDLCAKPDRAQVFLKGKKTCHLKKEFTQKITALKRSWELIETQLRLITHPLCPAGRSRNRGGWQWGTASPAWGHVPSNSCRNSNWPTSPPRASQTASAFSVQPLWIYLDPLRSGAAHSCSPQQ